MAGFIAFFISGILLHTITMLLKRRIIAFPVFRVMIPEILAAHTLHMQQSRKLLEVLGLNKAC